MSQTENEPNQVDSQTPKSEITESPAEDQQEPENNVIAETASASDQEAALLTTGQLEKAKDDYLRLAAEFDNYKKRTARDFANLVRTANEGLIVELLDVLDNFERAFKSRDENPDLDAYHKGIKLLYDRLSETLAREGLKRFDSVGLKFDPRLHEAVMQVDGGDSEPDTIALEIQPGYTLNDKVIRHARVGVVKARDDG
jgi:molecular chaperone GrpE